MTNHNYHIVYETTCLNTGKKYIGKHSTNNLNDGYLGSGTRLVKEVSRLGKHCFTRKIISEHGSAYEAFNAERDLLKSSGAEQSVDYYNLPKKNWRKVKKVKKKNISEKQLEKRIKSKAARIAKRTAKIELLKTTNEVNKIVSDCLYLQDIPADLDGTVNNHQRRALCLKFDMTDPHLNDNCWPSYYRSLSKEDNRVKAFNSLVLIHKKYKKLVRFAVADLIYSHFNLKRL